MIGERLAAIRGDNDETQAELAEKLSVSVYTVRSWERNASAPSNEILVQICTACQRTICWVLPITTRTTPAACTKQNLPRASAAN